MYDTNHADHDKDEDCGPIDETGCCIECGASWELDPCSECAGVAFHRHDCYGHGEPAEQ